MRLGKIAVFVALLAPLLTEDNQMKDRLIGMLGVIGSTLVMLAAIPTADALARSGAEGATVARGPVNQKELVNPYDNCQFHWSELSVTPDGTEREIATCEYRSREGQYYRIDRTEVDEKGNTTHSRLIVRPEGFVLQQNRAIVAFGSTSDGMQRLYNEPIFEASKRGYYGYTEAVIRECSHNPECKLTIHRSASDSVDIELSYNSSAQQSSTTYHYVHSLRSADGANVKWVETKRTNDAIVGSTIVEKQYDGVPVPANVKVIVQDISESPSISYQLVSNRTFYEPRPAAIEDFNISDFPAARNGWSRRAALLVAGIVFLAGALILRRRAIQ